MNIRIRRLIAGLIDLYISAFLAGSIMNLILGNVKATDENMFFYSILFAVFILIKDLIFKNQSVGKKICGIEMIDNTTHQRASIKVILLRNLILILLFPIEIWLPVFSKKRLADNFLGTRIVKSNFNKKKPIEYEVYHKK